MTTTTNPTGLPGNADPELHGLMDAVHELWQKLYPISGAGFGEFLATAMAAEQFVVLPRHGARPRPVELAAGLTVDDAVRSAIERANNPPGLLDRLTAIFEVWSETALATAGEAMSATIAHLSLKARMTGWEPERSEAVLTEAARRCTDARERVNGPPASRVYLAMADEVQRGEW